MNHSIKILSKISNPLLKEKNTFITKAENIIYRNVLLPQNRNLSSIIFKKLTLQSTPSTLLKRNNLLLNTHLSLNSSKFDTIQSRQFNTLVTNPYALTVVDLKSKVFNSNALIINRKYQWFNVFLGYEQTCRYKINNEQGINVGYIEEESTFWEHFIRNFITIHRRFKATVMDTEGNPILKLYRPFYLLNSKMLIEDANGELLGEIHQRYHPFRRVYDLYQNKQQIAQIDVPFLSWEFPVRDMNGKDLALVFKNFTNIGREIFTDANQYAVKMGAPFVENAKNLSTQERAIIVSMAICIDFNYFSRHSDVNGWWIPNPGLNGQEQTTAEVEAHRKKSQFRLKWRQTIFILAILSRMYLWIIKTKK